MTSVANDHQLVFDNVLGRRILHERRERTEYR